MSRMNARKRLPSSVVLHELLRYEPSTGKLYWRERTSENCQRPAWFNSRYAGTEAFTSTLEKGYKVGLINKATYQAHRVIWKMCTGEDPGDQSVDHINRNPCDNRIENLRLASCSENQYNKTPKKNGSSKFKGVGSAGVPGRWQSWIRVDGVRINLGTFDSEEEAAQAYDAASIKLHGDFYLNNERLGLL